MDLEQNPFRTNIEFFEEMISKMETRGPSQYKHVVLLV